MNGRIPIQLFRSALAPTALSLLFIVNGMLPVLEVYAVTLPIHKPWNSPRTQNIRSNPSGKKTPSAAEELRNRLAKPATVKSGNSLDTHTSSTRKSGLQESSLALAAPSFTTSPKTAPMLSNPTSTSVLGNDISGTQQRFSSSAPRSEQVQPATKAAPLDSSRRFEPSTELPEKSRPPAPVDSALSQEGRSTPKHEHFQTTTVLEMAAAYKEEGLTTIMKALGSPPTSLELALAPFVGDAPKWERTK